MFENQVDFITILMNYVQFKRTSSNLVAFNTKYVYDRYIIIVAKRQSPQWFRC